MLLALRSLWEFVFSAPAVVIASYASNDSRTTATPPVKGVSGDAPIASVGCTISGGSVAMALLTTAALSPLGVSFTEASIG